MNEPADDKELAELLERAARYDEASRLGKAARQLTQRALHAKERERLRRHSIGVEGRIAEDAVRAVLASDPIWALLARHGLPEDASTRELAAIQRFLVGRRTRRADRIPNVSIRSARDALRLSLVSGLVPGQVEPVDSYRYATLDDPANRSVEPFLVLLRTRPRGDSDVLATLHLGATFLRHEQEFGLVDPDRLETLATLVEHDVLDIRKAHQALLEL